MSTNSADKMIIFQQEELIIPQDLTSIPLVDLGVKGCNHLLLQLKRIGKRTFSDFPTEIDDLYLKLDGVGLGMMEKFWDQLPSLLSIQKQLVEEINADGEKALHFNGQKIAIPEELLEYELHDMDFSGVAKAIQTIKENGITRLGDLPKQFSKLSELQGVGDVTVRRIFEQIESIIDTELQKLALQQLTTEERLRYEMSNYLKWAKQICECDEKVKNEKIPPRYLRLLNDRYEATKRDIHLTLKELGDQEGVTRERIRQILVRGDKQIAKRWYVIGELIHEYMMENGKMVVDEFFGEYNFFVYLLANALETAGIYVVEKEDLRILTTLNKEEFAEFEKEVQHEAEDAFHLHVITQSDFKQFIKKKATNASIPPMIIAALATQAIDWYLEDQGVLKNITKMDAVEMVMLQYPEGAAVYKEEMELNRKANKLMPGRFKQERDFTEVLARDEIIEKVILWGRGVYIHTDFISPDKKWIHKVQDIGLQLLEQEDFIHARKLYETVKTEAKQRNVPNEYALFSLMRLFDKGILSLERFPNIQLAGIERQTNDKWVLEFMEEQSEPVPIDTLVDVFVKKRGWKRFTLEQTLFRSEEIIQYRHGIYTLLSRYDYLKEEEISEILSAIRAELTDKSIISVRSIFSEHEVVLRNLGIDTHHVLYAILKRIGISDNVFIRFPYIVSADYEEDVLPGRVLVEDYIFEQNQIVSREEAELWLNEIVGENEKVLDFALLHSDQLLYYARGQKGQYVHRNTIGMDKEKERQIHEIVLARLHEVIIQKNRQYTLLDELYVPSAYPKLANNIPWSKELLGDLLKKSSLWTKIGSYDEIIVPADDPIIDEIDFIDYVLKHHFDGKTKVSIMQSFLADIRFSSRGQFLLTVEEALEKNEAPFLVQGEEIIDKQLVKGLIHER